MPPQRSPELESVARRFLMDYAEVGLEVMSNLLSIDDSARVIGNAQEEVWSGRDEILAVRTTQIQESPDIVVTVHDAEAFEEGNIGWFAIFFTLTTDEFETDLRASGVTRLEGGVWRIVQWHNSVPVSNQQIFGVELTRTLDDLVGSVLSDAGSMPSGAATEGTLTLVFTDIVGSTSLAERIGDEEWTKVVGSHEGAIRKTTDRNNGTVVKMIGDGSLLAFDSARSAVRAAVELQKETDAEQFSIRIGVHTGEVMRTGDDLLGLTVNKAARIASATNGDGITISATTRDLIGSMDGVIVAQPETVALKGLSGTHQIVRVNWT
ncbi:MAG: nuclear transport factor 2 family protein [Acidimicrobiia bacterium]